MKLPHFLQRCRGPAIKKEYIPPRRVGGEVKAWGADAEQRINEIMYGVTLFHHKCSTCGQKFTNRHIGDWRGTEEEG